jgi:hypothetical protein
MEKVRKKPLASTSKHSGEAAHETHEKTPQLFLSRNQGD